MTDANRLSEAFDDYMFWLGFLPIGEDIRGNLCWREEDALPVLEALRLTGKIGEELDPTIH